MKALQQLGSQLLGLFVDDWTFAAAIALWVALVACGVRLTGGEAGWLGPLLFAGLSVVFLASVFTASKRRP